MKKSIISILLLFIITNYSCVKDPENTNEEELITTLKFALTPLSGAGTLVELVFKDLDGDGGSAPQITGGILQANTTYKGVLTLSNDQSSPSEDITAEILTEALEHQFFFAPISGLNINVRYDDGDSAGNPIGLKTIVQTSTASSGKLRVTLRHEPNKNATGVKNGDISNAGGETDIEIEFPVNVQ